MTRIKQLFSRTPQKPQTFQPYLSFRSTSTGQMPEEDKISFVKGQGNPQGANTTYESNTNMTYKNMLAHFKKGNYVGKEQINKLMAQINSIEKIPNKTNEQTSFRDSLNEILKEKVQKVGNLANSRMEQELNNMHSNNHLKPNNVYITEFKKRYVTTKYGPKVAKLLYPNIN